MSRNLSMWARTARSRIVLYCGRTDEHVLHDQKVKLALKRFIKSDVPVAASSMESQHGRAFSSSRAVGEKRKATDSHQVLDPFAIKLSIPPIVLLSYAIWKYYGSEDPRRKSIREAEERHEAYMLAIADEKYSSDAIEYLGT